MKTIEQLLELSQNEHYVLTNEEQERLDAFLAARSGQQDQAESSGSSSSHSTHATVRAANTVVKHDTYVPVEDNAVDPEVGELEEEVHPDAVK